jgi:transcriptional pleiotropic regulator of transition state genes
MKSTGIVRKVDPLGRIVIPMELRRCLKINENDSLEIYTEGEQIILSKYNPGCSCCEEITKDLKEVNGIVLCQKCISKFNKL